LRTIAGSIWRSSIVAEPGRPFACEWRTGNLLV
jgi:hypothetical protein